MARPPKPIPTQPNVELNMPALRAAHDAATELSLLLAERVQRAADLADKLGYHGPLEQTVLVHLIRDQYQRTTESALALGRLLLILREAATPEEFFAHRETLQIDRVMAHRCMSAALKFSTPQTTKLIRAAGGQSKMLELLVLDDEEIKALENGDSARDMALDDIERMSTRELRAALRTANEDVQAKQQLIEAKNQQMDELASRRKWKPKEDSIATTEQEEHLLVALEAGTRQVNHFMGKLIPAVIDAASTQRPAMRLRATESVRFLLQQLHDTVYDLGLDLGQAAGGADWLPPRGL
jgi:hypothetical protein